MPYLHGKHYIVADVSTVVRAEMVASTRNSEQTFSSSIYPKQHNKYLHCSRSYKPSRGYLKHIEGVNRLCGNATSVDVRDLSILDSGVCGGIAFTVLHTEQ